MPHAENSSMTDTLTNGDKSSSQFISHLTSYPVVSDSIETFKSNPYGQKSLSIAEEGYKSIVAPVLPYAQGPYGYVKPYVEKADEIANGGLTRVDKKFPIVKEGTQQIKGSIFDLAFMPLRLAGEGKRYVFKTYSSEYKKCGGDGLLAGGKAMVTTSLVVTSDGLAWLSTFLQQKKEEAKEIVKDKTGN